MDQSETQIAKGSSARVLDGGATEVVVRQAGGAGWAGLFGVFWFGVGVFGILTPSGWDSGAATPFLLFAVCIIPGAWLVIYSLHALVFERRWLVRGGEMAWRRRIRGLDVTTDGPFEPVARVKIAHGIWKTGRGCTDTLRIYRGGTERPTAIDSAERTFPKRAAASIDQSRSDLESDVDPAILALARLFASRLGRKLQIVVETISEPSSGD
ncbi:MAG: hypothetical protein M3O80_06365 [Chloroflexota bacterium]|nr:hypothetical protein [Chloroflexota bacterium]